MTKTPNRSRSYMAFRNEVYARDQSRCRYCGASDDLVLEHVVPQSAGGTDNPANLVTACRACNAVKSKGPLRPVSVAEHKKLIARNCASIDWIWTSTLRTTGRHGNKRRLFRRLYHVRGILWDDDQDWLLKPPDMRRPVEWVKGRPIRKR